MRREEASGSYFTPCILAGVVAPHHCGSVRTEHNGEDVRARNNLGDVCRTIKN
jgi:hypothetical protein